MTMLHHLLDLDRLRKLLEEAYREGFQDGADHGNLQYKYPPEDIAVLQWRKAQHHLFGVRAVLSREELLAIRKWDEASFEKRIVASNFTVEEVGEGEAVGEEEPAGVDPVVEELRRFKEAAVWFAGDDVGVAASCLVTTALGLPYRGRWGIGEPSDAADRGRCVRAIQRMPWIRPALEVLEKKHWQWQEPARLIRAELGEVASEGDEKPQVAGSPGTVAGS